MAQTDFLCCALSCACLMKFATSCSWHILRQVRLTNFVQFQFHCQARPGHSLNCFRCAVSAVCGSHRQLAMDEDKTLIYQAVNLRPSISDEVHAAIGDAARRSKPRGVHKSGNRMRGGHAEGISINRTLNGLTCMRRLLIQSYPTSFRLRLLNNFACIMSTK